MEQGNYGYSTGGYTIGGLKNIANKDGELRDGWAGMPEDEEKKETAGPSRPARFMKYPKEVKDEILRLRKEERMRCSDIARRFGMTTKAVESIVYNPPVYVPCGRGQELTEKQLEWLERHFKHTKNEDIMKRLSISHSSLHRLARRLGLKKSPQHKARMLEYATRRANESNESNGTYPPKGFQIPNRNTCRKGECILDKLSPKRRREAKEKRAATMRELREREKRRVLFGLEQETRLKVIAQPKEKRTLKYRMKRKGYVCDKEHPGTLLYGPNTDRSRKMERSAAKWGIEVKPLE